MKNELYDLASRVNEIAHSDNMNKRRMLWRKHNSFQGDRPLIYLRAFAFDEAFDSSVLRCKDPELRKIEYNLHNAIYRSTLGDDFVVEPWVERSASYVMNNGQRWGVPIGMGERPMRGGAAAFRPVLLEEDFSCLVPHPYEVDEHKTELRAEKIQEALGGALPLFMSREGPFNMWSGDLSTDLAQLRGLEQIMWDVYDNPDWLHSLLAFMRDTVMKSLDDVEAQGGFSLADHENQCIPYSMELEDPNPNVKGVKRNQLWRFMAAQEFTGFGPDMYREFMLQYQKPILDKFGLVSYGCCENMAGKIPYIKKIKNIRRISITPFSEPRQCAEEIGTDCIASWRPNPSCMVATGLDEDFVRKYMRKHFDIFKENHTVFDITLKDVETVSHHPENIPRWTQIVREEIEKAF